MLSVNPASSGSSASSANDNSSIAAFVSQNTIGILAVVPSRPTSVVAVRGNTQLAVTWTAPASTGGSAITDYLVKYSSNNGATWKNFTDPVSTATSCTVTGLTNGTPYVIKVVAKNAVGISPASANSAPVTPATVPGSPTSVVAVSGNTQLAVTWTAPASTGGSAITDYLVKYSSNNGATWKNFTDPVSTATSCTVTGLTNGTPYVIKVVAKNAVGISPASANSAPVTPALTVMVPSAPRTVVAAVGQGQLAITWVAPASPGGSAITDYLVSYSSNGGASWTAFSRAASTATSCTVTGLTNGNSYVIQVVARNGFGNSLPSANSAPATPAALVPDSPTSVVAVSSNVGQMLVTWVAPANTNGSAITDYFVSYSNNGGASWTLFPRAASTALSCTVTGLINGTSHVIQVVARNAAGNSLPSANSAPVTPRILMSMVTVGDAGNAADTTSYGAVSYTYQIGMYDVTGSEYAAFLNVVGKTDTYGLYNTSMGTDTSGAQISRSGTSGSYTYVVMNSTGNRPISYVSWFDCARFSNWMVNGQGSGSTETGAYTLVGGQRTGTAPAANVGASFRIPTENDWYKAAYYKGSSRSAGYWTYATQSNSAPGTATSSGANQANYDNAIGHSTDVSSFSGSGSFYGTFDQSGNVFQWNDLAGTAGSARGLRGGSWTNDSYTLSSSNRVDGFDPSNEYNFVGFRLVSGPLVPSAPRSVLAVSGNTSLAVTWTAPASTGGSAITDYVVKYSSNSGVAWTTFAHPVSTATMYTVTGLKNGTSYVIKVIAKNAVGISLPSANSAPVEPRLPVAMSMVTVGNPGNAADINTGSFYGDVSYSYQIGTYDVTGSQYTAFLNAVGSTDTYGLYNVSMGTDQYNLGFPQISRSGTAGTYTYAVMNSTGQRPITYVSWFDCVRFSNWMSNGQPSGAQVSTTTENGAYNVNGATSGNAVAANATNPNTTLAPTYRIPLENEWYKAAYYSPNYVSTGVGGYYAYATQSNVAPGTTIGSSANQANYNGAIGHATDVGSFSGSGSFYGTFDQSGNVYQWNDLDGAAGSSRGLRGGFWNFYSIYVSSSNRFDDVGPSVEYVTVGFRLASPVTTTLTPAFGSTTATADGFTVVITNYDSSYTWAGTATASGSVSVTGSGSTGLATITGVAAGTSSTATITTTQTGYTGGTANVTQTSVVGTALTPTFGTQTATGDGFTVVISNYDSAYTWAGTATASGSVAIDSTGLATITGVAPGTSSTATITTTRAGYTGGTADITETSLAFEIVVNMSMVTVGNPGNEADVAQPYGYARYGAVSYSYQIGAYDVTGSQYTAFLNAVGSTDTYALYNPSMGTDTSGAQISRSGTAGTYTYAVMNSTGQRPITYVSWFDCVRFSNWMSNGQPSGAQVSTTTENGAYNVITGDTMAANATNPNTGLAPTFRMPLENEWYKAAYYSPNYGGAGVGGYYAFATQSDTAPGTTIGSSANQANYDNAIGHTTDVGSFSGSGSFYGTFDQSGNVYQLNAKDGTAGLSPGLRGGYWYYSSYTASSSGNGSAASSGEHGTFGFRLASPVTTTLTPTFGVTSSTVDGFFVQITNYDSSYTWAGTATASGSVAISGTGLVTVTNVAAGTSSTATITTTKSNTVGGSATVTATLLAGARNPTFGATTPTADGFTVQISNYDSSYTWAGTATASGTVAISGSGLVTVTGVAAGTSSTATITTTRAGYAGGSATVTATSLFAALTPTFGATTATSNGFTVQISNYNALYTWAGTATASGSVVVSGTGFVTVTNVAAGTSSTATITTTQTGYVGGSNTVAATSLNTALTPAFGTTTATADGFTVVITNYDANYTWAGTATASGSVSVTGSGLVTVTGVAAGTSSTATITTTRTGYAVGSAPVMAASLTAGALAVNMSMVTVGNAGNAPDTGSFYRGYGAVSYSYQIGAYDVTVSQYTAFLNAVGSTDTYALYDASMGTSPYGYGYAQISRSGSSGSFTYAVLNSTGQSPITYVSWFDCARFSNWMSNGQPSGAQTSTTTENGTYNVNGATSYPANAVAANTTNPNTNLPPTYRIPLENEWYKAAYYSPNYGGTGGGGYYVYATQSNVAPGTTIGSTANQANYNSVIGTATDVGAFSGSGSFYGTFDQSGNVWQWNDLDGTTGSSRGLRGGVWNEMSSYVSSSHRYGRYDPSDFGGTVGFRLAGPV